MKFLKLIKKQIWLVIGISVLILLIIDLNTRISTLHVLEEQRSTLEADVANLEHTKVVIDEEIDYARSDNAVDEWARQQGLMRKEDDYVIIPLPSAVYTPTPLPEAEVQVTPVENWEVWKSLIFD